MDIESAGKNQNIRTSLFFRESVLYAKINDVKLANLFKDMVRNDFNRNIGSWVAYLNDVMCGKTNDDFYIFPILAKYIEIEEGNTEKTIYTILNRPDARLMGAPTGTHNGNTFFLLDSSGLPYSADGKEMDKLLGYGIAPFLKFTYVLRKLFSMLGYSLAQSRFDTDAGFQKLCFIHNTVDCLCRGNLDYSQLVPDVSVTDFLTFIENSFGCRFIVSETDKTITPRFWKDVIVTQSDKDISRTFEDYPLTTFSSPKSLKLTVNRITEDAAPYEFDNYRAMLQRYGSFKGSYRNIAVLENLLPKDLPTPIYGLDGVYYIQDIRHYAQVRMLSRPIGMSNWQYFYVVDIIEKDTLDLYDVEKEANHNERSLGFNAITLQLVPLTGVKTESLSAERDTSRHPQFINGNPVFIPPNLSGFLGFPRRMPYINSLRHLNTVEQTTTTQNNETMTETNEEKSSDCPVMLCFSHGFYFPGPFPGQVNDFFGSPDAYDANGNKIGTFDLSTRSLYEHFWEEYDALLRTSFHDIAGAAYLSLSDVMNLRFDVPVNFHGQKVLPEAIQYELSDKGVEVVDFKVKLIKRYE
jgi:hypothetical protein